jgi:DnaB-like helicase C terminal domain
MKHLGRIQELETKTKLRSRSTLVEQLDVPDLRLATGFPKIDNGMRGFRPGLFSILAGAPHAGKTLVALNIVFHNNELPMLFVTADEPASRLWLQLGAMVTEVPVEVLEESKKSMQKAVSAAMELFPMLEIVDEALDVREMGILVDDYLTVHDIEPDLLFYDYLSKVKLGERDNGDWNGRANALKSFATRSGIHIISLAQPKKSYYDSVPSIEGLSNGGEQQCFNLLWSERREMMPSTYDDDDIDWPEDTCPAIHLSLLKAKNGRIVGPEKAEFLGITPWGRALPYKQAHSATIDYHG